MKTLVEDIQTGIPRANDKKRGNGEQTAHRLFAQYKRIEDAVNRSPCECVPSTADAEATI